MESPHIHLKELYFSFKSIDKLLEAMGEYISESERIDITNLSNIGLPPVTSIETLSTMLGLSPNFVWYIKERTKQNYRYFPIPKGKGVREIEAPRVSLKIIQKWLAYHFSKKWVPLQCVHGFTPGKSHVSAAKEHLKARWVISMDIENFFLSTPLEEIKRSLINLGYRNDNSIEILSKLCSLNERLPQGAPTSPIISNISMNKIDEKILELSSFLGITYTRYADDITLSGKGEFCDHITREIEEIFSDSPWRIKKSKTHISFLPNRLKVHGLLIHGENIRLTKGYRNKIRAFKHLKENGKIKEQDIQKVIGHLNYSKFIENYNPES